MCSNSLKQSFSLWQPDKSWIGEIKNFHLHLICNWWTFLGENLKSASLNKLFLSEACLICFRYLRSRTETALNRICDWSSLYIYKRAYKYNKLKQNSSVWAPYYSGSSFFANCAPYTFANFTTFILLSRLLKCPNIKMVECIKRRILDTRSWCCPSRIYRTDPSRHL